MSSTSLSESESHCIPKPVRTGKRKKKDSWLTPTKLTGVRDGHGLSVAAAAGHVHDAVTPEAGHQGGRGVVLRVAVAQAPVVAAAPGVELTAGGDGRAVGAAR